MAITEKTVLFKGSKEKENIKILQDALKVQGYYKYKVDGKFETETAKSIRAFQKTQGLVVDGRAGPITNKKLGILKTKTSGTTQAKSVFHKTVEKSVGAYNTFTEYYNLIKKNKTWKEYYNDIYDQLEELQRLKEDLPLNCTDHCQTGYAVAKDLGYEARFVHIKCKKSGGHIALDVKGKELGSNWVRADLAAAANSDYSLGKYWCPDGTIISYNDPWLLSNDGKT